MMMTFCETVLQRASRGDFSSWRKQLYDEYWLFIVSEEKFIVAIA